MVRSRYTVVEFLLDTEGRFEVVRHIRFPSEGTDHRSFF